jgi:hypothetical protein
MLIDINQARRLVVYSSSIHCTKIGELFASKPSSRINTALFLSKESDNFINCRTHGNLFFNVTWHCIHRCKKGEPTWAGSVP